MVSPPLARAFRLFRGPMGAGLLFLCLPLCQYPSTREQIENLEARAASLEERMGQFDRRLAAMEELIGQVSSRLEAVARSSQTADLRADLDQIKRQIETISSQVSALRSEALRRVPLPDPITAGSVAPPFADAAAGAPSDTPPDLYGMAHREYVLGRYDLAASKFRQFLAASPSDPKAANAQYWIGECLYSQKRWAEAGEAFKAVNDRYPKSSKDLAARLKTAFCHLASGEERAGRLALEALAKEHPESEEARLAKERLDRLPPP